MAKFRMTVRDTIPFVVLCKKVFFPIKTKLNREMNVKFKN